MAPEVDAVTATLTAAVNDPPGGLRAGVPTFMVYVADPVALVCQPDRQALARSVTAPVTLIALPVNCVEDSVGSEPSVV